MGGTPPAGGPGSIAAGAAARHFRVIVSRRQPRNPVGWILIGFIVLFLFSGLAGFYAVFRYNFGHHGLPLAQAGVILQPLWAPAIQPRPL